jgi:CDGSH-type Zn-finger protein
VTPTRDGPLELAGAYELRGDADDSSVSETGGWLCRCGGSENKPFCDGTHSAIGFTTDDV